MPTATELLQREQQIKVHLDRLHDVLNSFPRDEMGLTPDEVKRSSEWKKAKADWNYWFNAERENNKQLNKIRKHIGFEVKDGKRISIYQYE